MTSSVLISGASVAGPALAFFLHRAGYDVTVVERAPAPRAGGYSVDFRGAALDVLAEMDLLDDVRAHETGMRGTVLVDENGAEVQRWGAEVFGGDLEVPKRELTRLLHRATADVRYVFDDSITALAEHDAGVAVEFEQGAARSFDLVVGADGVYSNVRRLAFDAPGALRHLGMSGAGFSVPNVLGLDHTGVLQPGAGTALFAFHAGDADRLTVSLSFATGSPALDRQSRSDQEAAVRAAFAGRGWIVPALLDAMSDADDYYFGSTCQVELDRWSEGRIPLVGDAAYCAAPTSGMGTSQALIGARTLARRLVESGGDHRGAFRAYENDLRPYVRANQALGRDAAAMFGAA